VQRSGFLPPAIREELSANARGPGDAAWKSDRLSERGRHSYEEEVSRGREGQANGPFSAANTAAASIPRFYHSKRSVQGPIRFQADQFAIARESTRPTVCKWERRGNFQMTSALQKISD
jgi:hypothetical protein